MAVVSVNSDDISITMPAAIKMTPRISNTLAIHGALQQLSLSLHPQTDVTSLMCSCFSFIITSPVVGCRTVFAVQYQHKTTVDDYQQEYIKKRHFQPLF